MAKKLTKEIMEVLGFKEENKKWKFDNITFESIPDNEEFLFALKQKYILKGMGIKIEQIKRILEV